MKAIVLSKYGSPDFFKLKEIKKPKPKDNEVLVKVYAASINSWDWEILIAKPFVNRLMAGMLKPTKIKILGCDIAGKVEVVGKNIKRFRPGDQVFGDLSGSGWGGFAEYVCVREKALIQKSENMTFEQAAAIPQAGLLALQALQYKKDIQAGQKILFNGAGGGVGTLGIQIAKSFGAEVTAVDKTEKLEVMNFLGADHVIDYTKEDFTKNGQTYEKIIDVAAARSITAYKGSLSSNGIFVMVGGVLSLANKILFLGPWISKRSNKKVGLLFHRPNEGLEVLKALFDAKKIVPVIDSVYSLNDVTDAFRHYEKGLVKGKIIINISDHLTS
ncbi:MAG: NAD(P)-dependent alcohol dehydrogenase [Cellvibrionaceae bacterium]